MRVELDRERSRYISGWMKLGGAFMVCCLFLGQPAEAATTNLFTPTGLGAGLLLTHQDGNIGGDPGFGPGIQFSLRYRNPSGTFISAGSGFYTLTDDVLKMNRFKTTVFPSVEIQYGKYFGVGQLWMPSLYGGVNLYAAFDNTKTQSRDYYAGERFFQMSGFFGGGLEYQPNYLYSIYINADYRYVLLASDNGGRQYAVMQIGFLFYQ